MSGYRLWVLATFVVMVLLLAKLAFKPITQALEKRGQTIKQALDDAEKSRVDGKKLLEDYQKQLADARTEAGKLMEEARQIGEQVRKEVVEKANTKPLRSCSARRKKFNARRKKASRS